ncbi:vacuolar sorting protein 39-like [Impatiens glandulifera]|uniref:vacuolar sorting protein 39-like n=1 Tax=Impatiens glandulifera TaxID=253017 RepID=UPI001FB06BAC|nr:vacuolar sorting protein 39-like [Impatiens glandulifera]
MVHNAYDSFELIRNCPTKIDAVESFGSKIFLGCSDGSIRIYAPESVCSENSPQPDYRNVQSLELLKEPYILERTVNGFSKKPLLAMEVLDSRELLLSLSESIAFHLLPNLETFAVITKAKGANVYSWDDRRGFLCFARQKRVCIFRHDGGRGFVEVKDFGVPDTVKSLSWCGENICLGIKREYMILNSTNGALSQVFPSGRTAPPLVITLPSGELLLGKDNIGVLVDQGGKLVQEGRVCWSEAPTSIVIQNLYAIGLLPRHVEVRSLRNPYPLIQTVVLRNVRHLREGSNTIIIALDNTVYGLFPVPLGAQIVQLTASGNFDEALAVCKLLPLEESSLRASKEQSIHIRYAHSLFENGNYEEAMEHFLASQVGITYVLSMYPSITIPKLATTSEPEKIVDITGESAFLSRSLSGLSDDMESSLPATQIVSEEITTLESKKLNHNTLMALIKFLQKKRHSIIERAAAEGTDEVVSDAVGDNFLSYDAGSSKKSTKARMNITISSGAREMAAILDTALVQALIMTGQSKAAVELLKSLNYCDVNISEEFLQKKNEYVSLLELYKSNSMHDEALKLLHHLVEESMSNQSKTELPQKFKPEMIIEYLKPLCVSDPMLVLGSSMVVLERCPTQTIELFLSGNIPADLVNSYLKQHAPNLQTTYLELMLSMNENGMSGNLQIEMIQIYLSEVLDWYADLSTQQKWDEKDYSPTRKKLLSALENITGYNPDLILHRLPKDALYEERAILLGKMNQHELALSIHVHKLHLPELALSYCDRIYDSTLNQHSSAKANGIIYLTLLQIYLNPKRATKNIEKRITNPVSLQRVGSPKSKLKGSRSVKKIAEIEGAEDKRFSRNNSIDSARSDVDTDGTIEEVGASNIMLEQVLDLLSRRWDRFNGAQALKLLPRESKLQNFLPFLGPLIRKSSETYRNLSVIKSLRGSENLQVKDELYKHRKTQVKITSDCMCSLCNKKIGTSVFAVYPNGTTLVHLVCFRDSQNMKAVVKNNPRRRR